MRVREVDLPLASLDGLEPDFVPQIDAAEGRQGDHALTEASVKQLNSARSARDRRADSYKVDGATK